MTSVSRILVLFFFTSLVTGAAFAEDSISVGANVNMVSGQAFPNGDPFQRQQNEPSVAYSSRNSLHLLSGANDYRAVDVPGLPGGRETGDSWLSYFWSTNGGATWKSTLIPGYPQDPACLSANPPVLCDYAAGADPVVRAGVNGMFYYSGIVFERTDPSRSAIFVSRFIDLNNDEGGDPIRYIDTKIIDANNDGTEFLDKSWIGVDIPRGTETKQFVGVSQRGTTDTVDQTVACGNIYVGYAAISGEGSTMRSEIRMATSEDCGDSWLIQVISESDTLNQGANIAISPDTGDVNVVWRRFDTVESFLGISPVGCPASPASWEINSDWPVSEITMGGVTYTIAEAQALLGTKHKGDESIKLAYEVIAAKLNLLTGGGDLVDGFNPSHWAQDMQGLIDDAEVWFADHPVGSDPKQADKKAGQTIKKNIQEILQGSGSCTDSGETTTTTGETNAIIFTSSSDFGATFSTPKVIDESSTFDQGSTRFSFRTTAYPTIAADKAGRIYVAWAARGYASIRGEASDGDARIVISTSSDGNTWSDPYAIDEPDHEGHQIKPSMLFAGGHLTLVFYDFRQDVSNIFEGFVIDIPDGERLRHTVDVRIATAIPGDTPEFTDYSLISGSPTNPSSSASRYTFFAFPDENLAFPDEDNPGVGQTVQVEYMVPNFPMFADGTTPFIGDYVDVAAPNLMIDEVTGAWRFATDPGDVQVWQAVWSDNRDVRPPPDGDWSKYVAPITVEQPSYFDPSVTIPNCEMVTFPASDYPLGSYYTGTRNQNVYSASISNGVIVAAPGNNRPLGTFERGFVVYVQNTTGQARNFRLSLPSTTANTYSFAPNESALTKDVAIPPYSSAVATVFATLNSGQEREAVRVSVAELGGGTLTGSVVLNSDAGAPDPLAAPTPLLSSEVHNPAILNKAFGDAGYLSAAYRDSTAAPSAAELAACTNDPTKCVLNPAVFNPAVFNPAVLNPAVFNPAIMNPAIFNPAVLNPAVFNPAVMNPAVFNPAVMNPAVLNPAILNPAVFNPAIFNPAVLNPAVLNPAVMNPAILNPAILNPAVFNPAVLNPAVMNPAILNPAIFNSTVQETPQQVDVTFAVRNDGNATTGYDLNLDAPQIEGLDYELLVYSLNETPVAQGCVLTTEAQQQLVFSQNDPLNNSVDGSFYLEPGKEVLVTFRVRTDTDPNTQIVDPVEVFDVADLSAQVSAQPLNTDPTTQPPADQFGPAANVVLGTAGGTTIGGGGTPPANAGTLAAGQQVLITATGFVRRGAGFALDTPNGSGSGCNLNSNCLLPGAPDLSLVARIGNDPWQFVGEGPTILTATSAGDLEFGVNDNFFNDNSGSFYVTVSPYVAVTPILSSTFDSDADGWTIANDGIPASLDTLGNPLGYFRGTDQGSGQYWYFRAPAPYLGNRSASYGGELRYELRQFSGFGSVSFPPWVVLAGGGLTLIYDGSAQGAPGNVWTPFAVPLDANSPGWYLATNNCWTGTGDSCGFTGATPPTPAEFQSVLANLDTLLIRGEYTIGGDSAGLDNVELTIGNVNQPVSLWRADGNAFDSVGDNDGQLQNGAGYAPGRVGQAFSFDGSNQYVVVADDPSLDITTELTMAAWIYPTGNGSTPDGGIVLNKEWAYEFARFADGTIRWATGNGTNSFDPVSGWVNSGVVAPLNEWTHVVVTYNQGFGTTYINGTEVHTFDMPTLYPNYPTGNLGAGTQTLRIGGRPLFVQYFDGRIDEVGIYDTALAAADVQNLYNATAPFTQTVITGDSDILSDGVLLVANDLGGSPSAVTVNGVTFGTYQGDLGTGQGDLIGLINNGGGGDFSVDPFSANLDALLSDLKFTWNPTPVSLTISGLTPGKNYRLQLLFSNDHNSTGNNVEVTVEGETWKLNGWQPNAINLTARFTATSSSVVTSFAPGVGSDSQSGRAVLNAYVIHEMP